MGTIGLIPARLGSKRLPRKPLEIISGYPMFYHVFKRAEMSNLEKVYLCTESKLIYNQAKNFNIPTIITNAKHRNGTERCGEATEILGLKKNDIVLNIHGDEPLIDPNTLNKVLIFFQSNKFDIVFPHIEIPRPLKNNLNSVKIIVNQLNKVIYLSRSLIPSEYTLTKKIKKQCGITAFTKQSLDRYISLDESINEKIEKIELLRAIDNNLKVGSVLINKQTLSVDTYQDLIKVRNLIKKDKIITRYI